MKTHADRFRHLMNLWGLTQEELGKLFGIKRGTVGTILNGKTTPDADDLAQLLRNKPEINPDWLLTGNGPMTRGERGLHPILLGGEGRPQADQETSLRREVDGLREQLQQATYENSRLYKIIEELQATNRTSQEQISALVLKLAGSPSTYPVHPYEEGNEGNAQPRNRAGLRFYDEPTPIQATKTPGGVRRKPLTANNICFTKRAPGTGF